MTTLELYRLQPEAVRFPIALLTIGWFACLFGRWRAEWLPKAASWTLWLGTAAAWAAVGLGLVAENTAPNVLPAGGILHLHETLAYWTVALFTLLSLWRWRWERWREGLFLVLWLAACGVLWATAYHGMELVYTYGMGVAPK